MNIGLLLERKVDERRVALCPNQVKELVDSGHSVYVEKDCGISVGFDDASYMDAGGIVVEQGEVYDQARLLVKVKAPLMEEYDFLKPHHVLFTYLHFDENIPPEQIKKLVGTGGSMIAYEWVEVNGRFPLLQPMSELTGAVIARKSMDLLMARAGLLGGRYISTWPASTAMVIGVGNIGANAINVFIRNRFQLVIVDKHPETLRQRLQPLVSASLWDAAACDVICFDESDPVQSIAAIREHLPKTDIVICAAVRRPTLPREECEYILRREDVKLMRKNSVICDATACDRDLIETCVSSESLTETYVEEGVIHYNCDHIPSAVAATATHLLTDATFPYIRSLANLDFKNAVQQDTSLAKGVMAHQGQLVHAYSARKKGLAYVDLVSLL